MLQSLFRAFAPDSAKRKARSVKRSIFMLVGIGLCLAGLWMLYPIAEWVVLTGEIPPDAMQTLFISLVMCFIGVMAIVSARRQSKQHQQYAEALAHDQRWRPGKKTRSVTAPALSRRCWCLAPYSS